MSLIGKLKIHVQGYADQKEFYISPLLHEDVIFGVPWLHHMAIQLTYPNRDINFNHKGKVVLELRKREAPYLLYLVMLYKSQ